MMPLSDGGFEFNTNEIEQVGFDLKACKVVLLFEGDKTLTRWLSRKDIDLALKAMWDSIEPEAIQA